MTYIPKLPHPGSPATSAMIDSVLAEYEWPSNPKNAARAGYEAARRFIEGRLIAHSAQPYHGRREQEAAEFWASVIPPEDMSAQAVKNELTDYHFLLEQVPKVYYAVTGGLLSKPNYFATVVISAFEDYLTKHVDDAVKEALEEPPNVDGLARDIMLWMQMDGRWTGESLHRHLRNLGTPAPEWLQDEILDCDIVPDKATLLTCLWRAMAQPA